MVKLFEKSIHTVVKLSQYLKTDGTMMEKICTTFSLGIDPI